MIVHYLKIAWRNLLKYRMQSVVSILGLAVGLACFALSAFWIHYEMTYDTFHRDADRLYLVGVNDDSFGGSSASFTPYALGRYLKEHYSEIYNPQIQISAESETKRSIFREKDKTKRSKKESAQHSKSRNKSFVMTSVSAL